MNIKTKCINFNRVAIICFIVMMVELTAIILDASNNHLTGWTISCAIIYLTAAIVGNKGVTWNTNH